MSSDEVKIGEAVASLRARLDHWGVEDPHDKAHAYVNDMLRAGWRPVGYRYEQPTFNPRPTPAPAETVALARAHLAQARAECCSHGVPHARCAEKHDKETA